MFKLLNFLVILSIFEGIKPGFYEIYPGTYLTASPTQAYACGPVSQHQLVFYSTYFTYGGKTVNYFTSKDFMGYDNLSDIQDPQGTYYATTVTANNYSGLENGSTFRFGNTSTLFTLTFASNFFYSAKVGNISELFIADNPNELFYLYYNIELLKTPINNVSASAQNNYYKADTCLTIQLKNPCVYLPPETDFKITIPKISYPNNTQYEVNPFSNFNTSNCNVSLNGSSPTGRTCTVSGDSLLIQNLVTSYTSTGNLTLTVCNIKMNNLNESDAKIELLNKNLSSPSNIFADATFTVPVELGSILPRYITSEKTSVANNYYFKFGFATIEDIIINANSKIEIDFSSIPHSVLTISYNIYSTTSIVQSGNLSCSSKKCSVTLNGAYNLKNEFVMDISGSSIEFNSIYNTSFTVNFYNSSNRKLISYSYPIVRQTSDYIAYAEDSDIGLSSNLNLIFNNLSFNTSAYQIVISFGDYARINSTYFNELTINQKKISSANISINTTNNTLTASNIIFDSDTTKRILIRGVFLGPYDAGWNQITFTIKQNNANVYSKNVDLYTNMNRFTIKESIKRKIPNGYRFNITFAYDYPLYVDHFFRIGLPKQYNVNETNWFVSSQIPRTTAPSLSKININMSANLTYYKISNLFSKSDSKSSYSLVFDTSLLNTSSTGEYVELDVFADYSAITGLDNISSSYKIASSTAKTLYHDCPVNCYQCYNNKDICNVCSNSLTLNATDGLCYQANSMNQNVTNTDNSNNNININEYLFDTKEIYTFKKVLIAIAFNFSVMTIVLGLFLKLFYYEGSHLLEFSCASLTLVYSIVSYLFLLRIISELPKSDYHLELIYIIVSASCYVLINISITIFVYQKNRNSNIINNKFVDYMLVKVILFVICSIFGVAISLLFNSFNSINLLKKLYCDEKDVKQSKNVSLIVKWIASFTILLFSASTTLIYYISPVKSSFVYYYFVGSLLLFVSHLITIFQVNNSKKGVEKLFEAKFKYEKSIINVVKHENQNAEIDGSEIDVVSLQNSELNGYLNRMKEFEKAI